MKSFPNSNRGFTLIETFAAIIILLIAILGPLTLLSRAITDGLYAQNQITSSFLLQEGLDLTISRWDQLTKDNLDIDGLAPDINSCQTKSSACYVTVSESGEVSFSPSNIFSICLAPVSGQYFYQQNGQPCLAPNLPTIFTRKIWLENIVSKDTATSNESGVFGTQIGKVVHVQVAWKYKDIERTVNSSTILLK